MTLKSWQSMMVHLIRFNNLHLIFWRISCFYCHLNSIIGFWHSFSVNISENYLIPVWNKVRENMKSIFLIDVFLIIMFWTITWIRNRTDKEIPQIFSNSLVKKFIKNFSVFDFHQLRMTILNYKYDKHITLKIKFL